MPCEQHGELLGATLPESNAAEPMSVIFQIAEDGFGDTVKAGLLTSPLGAFALSYLWETVDKHIRQV